MGIKSAQVQIRVSPEQKRRLERAARRAGQSLSRYVLSRALPQSGFAELVRELSDESRRRFALASLNDLLTGLSPMEFAEAVVEAPLEHLDAYVQNYVAAMVEQAANLKGVPAPSWTRDIEPLSTPSFAAPLRSLRLHLIRSAPVAFRRRNLFVDAGVGDRV